MVVVQKGGVEFYIDGKLAQNLDKVRKKVTKKDEDFFFVVDGGEGRGKSVLTFQLAKYLDPTFTIDRIVFTPEAFRNAILNAGKGQAVVFDEAFRGLSSRGALTEVNKLLVTLMMECRQKNLYVFVVMPTFYLLDKYVALWRAKGLFHVYTRGGRKGFWMYFNEKKKRVLYLKGYKTYSYAVPRTNFRGRFLEQYTVDEEEYRALKHKALLESDKASTREKFMYHRNLLLWYLNKEAGLSSRKISEALDKIGWHIDHTAISTAVRKAQREIDKSNA